MKIIFYPILYLLFSLCVNFSYAQDYNVFTEDMVEVKLISSVTKVKKENFYIGLDFNLKPGWKIYWRQPGDSGLPPNLDYKNSTNLKSLEFKWPIPIKEYEAANLLTNIYKGNVTIPIEIAVEEYNKPLNLQSILNFQVCKDICIPFTTNLFLKLDSGESNYTKYFYKIEKALSKVPLNYKKLGIKNISIAKDSTKSLLLSLESALDFPEGIIEIFLENKDEYIKINKITIHENLNRKISTKLLLEKDIKDINNLDVIFVKGNLAISSKNIRIESTKSNNIYIFLFFAFIGGLILNFMPCVLPVLLLKINRILTVDNNKTSNIRYSFLLTALGIIFSFIFLAFITIFIKHITGQVGWGIQFQQPIFLLFLILILVIFSLSLFDKIQINLPSKLNNNINKYLGNQNNGVAFFEGALATLLATPCSAPFLGTAVSFALSSNLYITLLIFLFLGIGMSLPYLLFILFPSLVKFLPKPGKWMIYLRYILGTGLILTAIWLSYICVSIIDLAIFIYFISAIILFILIINRLYLKKYYLIFIISLLIGNIFISYDNSYLKYKYNKIHEKEWIKFSNKKLLNLIKQEKTVFVDITADWCITCKANKILVLNNSEFKQLILDNEIILMRGDWTQPNKEISDFLHRSNRYGIPFNGIYNTNLINGYLYSEILTLEEIRQSLPKLHSSNAK
ncbi:MAG: Thiol:disulfide interchange protein DsbD [Alphaproteobacteria bacterium MarineAlpha9_Bin3]|nr:MAG: Thiol:disulfide interchange protein DsbD [Alphaproteobacteria bacterium MarineAlpha9_Bin3]